MIELSEVNYLDLVNELRENPVAIFRSPLVDRQLNFGDFERRFWWTFFEEQTMARVGELGCIINPEIYGNRPRDVIMNHIAHPMGFKIVRRFADLR